MGSDVPVLLVSWRARFCSFLLAQSVGRRQGLIVRDWESLVRLERPLFSRFNNLAARLKRDVSRLVIAMETTRGGFALDMFGPLACRTEIWMSRAPLDQVVFTCLRPVGIILSFEGQMISHRTGQQGI